VRGYLAPEVLDFRGSISPAARPAPNLVLSEIEGVVRGYLAPEVLDFRGYVYPKNPLSGVFSNSKLNPKNSKLPLLYTACPA